MKKIVKILLSSIIMVILSLELIINAYAITAPVYCYSTLIANRIYYIKNVNSGKYLDVKGAADANGTVVQQYNFKGTNSQKWMAVWVPDGRMYDNNGVCLSGNYKFISMCSSSQRVLDVNNGGNENDTKITLWSQHGGTNQLFGINGGFYSNTAKTMLSKCSSYSKGVTVKYASLRNEEEVVQYSYNASLNDEWLFEKANGYERTDAATFAKKNAILPDNRRLTTYPYIERSIGGDCTNFISQALQAGGMHKLNSIWYINKLNRSFLKPETIPQLDYSWDLADPSPWISAPQFYMFFSDLGEVNSYSYDGSYINNNNIEVYTSVATIGDVVQIGQYNEYGQLDIFHTMMITGYGDYNGKRNFTLSYHTTDTVDKNLSQIVSDPHYWNNIFIFYHFNN